MVYNGSSMARPQHTQAGFTIVELSIAIVIIGMMVISLFGLYISLVQSAVFTQRKAIALTLATDEMEYLKSLPYDGLAVAGGSIIATSYVPGTITTTQNGVKYTTKVSISYIDDAYDGCGTYPNQQLKQLYCRNYPPPSGAPATDTNPADYKDISVSVYDPSNNLLASMDTNVAARVAETASTTGALFVHVLDDSGNPLSGATVSVTDNSLTPAVNVSDTTDSDGNAIFYDLPPDTSNYHYNVSASLANYSSLTTIAPSGNLQPTYSNQQIFAQQSALVTLTLKPQGSPSLLLQTTDTSGNPLGSVKVYIKGGYKKYSANTDTQYYYDNLTPSDTRPTTDSNGLAGVSNLVPGSYYFCGDAGATSCAIGNTTYYLAAAVPYGGTSALSPINVPDFLAANPPATTYPYNGTNYLQKVRLMLTTNSNFPRVTALTPSQVSQASDTLNNVSFTLTGTNMCTPSSSCDADVSFLQGSNSFVASCAGSSTAQNCTVNLSSASIGSTQLVISSNGSTLTLPASPLLGGINVTN
jgi:prepilin-type N-terminal cleavage/methylation domain-containing protein